MGGVYRSGQPLETSLLVMRRFRVDRVEKRRKILPSASGLVIEILAFEHVPEPQHWAEHLVQM